MTLARPLVFLQLEDDDRDAELVEARLQADGLDFELVRTQDERGFRRGLARRDLDAILSDFALPGYDGLRALDAAREALPDVPFVFVSGAIGEERAIETLRRGATDYVLKDRLDRLAPALLRAVAEANDRRLLREAQAERERLLAAERNAREIAESANRMKDEFLAIVSHELRTPLNAIVGWAALLGDGIGVDQATLVRGLSTIQRNAHMQARLIEDLLDISRIVTGKLELRRSLTSVEAVTRAVVDALRPAAEARDVLLVVEIGEETSTLFADPDRLEQIIWNLVWNGVKFMPPRGGVVRVATTRAGSDVRITVSDSGRGIAPELLPFVFERFRQGDGRVTRAHGGLGLGLAIVRHLVELHGGTIAVESPGLGAGATFTIELPGCEPEHAPLPEGHALTKANGSPRPPAIRGANLPLRGVRVLVVEDEPDARELVREVLLSAGAVVTECGSVLDAVRQLAASSPDVVISDIGMPQMDGYSLLRRVRASADPAIARLPAIALTAYASEADRRETEAAGYDRHLAKPVQPRALVDAVAKLVAERISHAPPARGAL